MIHLQSNETLCEGSYEFAGGLTEFIGVRQHHGYHGRATLSSPDARRFPLKSDIIRSTSPATVAGPVAGENNQVAQKPSAWITQPAHTKRHQPSHYGLTSGAWLSYPGDTGAGHGVVPRLPKDSVNDRRRPKVLYRTVQNPHPRTGCGFASTSSLMNLPAPVLEQDRGDAA